MVEQAVAGPAGGGGSGGLGPLPLTPVKTSRKIMLAVILFLKSWSLPSQN